MRPIEIDESQLDEYLLCARDASLTTGMLISHFVRPITKQQTYQTI
jgi:hypothetical protein